MNIIKPLLVEVELPNDNISKRRVAFYERNGFKQWKSKYFQPSYGEGKKSIELRLMVRGIATEEADFELFKKIIYKNVYYSSTDISQK